MYMMLKIARRFSRLFQSIGRQYFFDQKKIVFARFIFAFVIALFLSTISLYTEYLFVRLTGPSKFLSTAFEKKQPLFRFAILKIKQQSFRKVKKCYEKNRMDNYSQRIFRLFLCLDLGGFLNPWPFEIRKGSDVTRKAVLSLFRLELTDKPFVLVVIELPSAVQTMPEFLRRYGKQLHHTWNFNFCRGSDVNSREVWRIFFVLFWDFFCMWSLNQNTWGDCGTVNINGVQLNNTTVLCSVREVLSLLAIKSENRKTYWREWGDLQLLFIVYTTNVFRQKWNSPHDVLCNFLNYI